MIKVNCPKCNTEFRVRLPVPPAPPKSILYALETLSIDKRLVIGIGAIMLISMFLLTLNVLLNVE